MKPAIAPHAMPSVDRGERREQADHQRDAPADQAAHQQVAAGFVGAAECMFCERGRQLHRVPVGGIELVRQQHRADHARERDHREHAPALTTAALLRMKRRRASCHGLRPSSGAAAAFSQQRRERGFRLPASSQ